MTPINAKKFKFRYTYIFEKSSFGKIVLFEKNDSTPESVIRLIIDFLFRKHPSFIILRNLMQLGSVKVLFRMDR